MPTRKKSRASASRRSSRGDRGLQRRIPPAKFAVSTPLIHFRVLKSLHRTIPVLVFSSSITPYDREEEPSLKAPPETAARSLIGLANGVEHERNPALQLTFAAPYGTCRTVGFIPMSFALALTSLTRRALS